MRPAADSPNRRSASPNVAPKVRHSQRGMMVSTEPPTQTAPKLASDPPRVNYPLRRKRTTPPRTATSRAAGTEGGPPFDRPGAHWSYRERRACPSMMVVVREFADGGGGSHPVH